MHRLPTTYNEIAGRSLERLAALSDGVFAFAMTLLVLDLKVPTALGIRSSVQLWHALAPLAPRMVTYILSFLTLGIFWFAQQAQLHHCRQSDKRLAWIHVFYLLVVAIMPFSTALLSAFIAYPAAVMCYWLNLLLLGAALLASICYANKAGLLKQDDSAAPSAIHIRRILVYQGIYLVGALACSISTYLSIAIFLVAQFASILSPSSKLGTLRATMD
jgi:uncharacterized membrane protein